MKLQYIIIYVEDVLKAVTFYEQAFGLQTQFIHESNDYAEMQTGETTLAFAANEMLEYNTGISAQTGDNRCCEIAFTTKNVQASFARAVAGGAEIIRKPGEKPWGQTVAYVRDDFGTLVEICSPMVEYGTEE